MSMTIQVLLTIIVVFLVEAIGPVYSIKTKYTIRLSAVHWAF